MTLAIIQRPSPNHSPRKGTPVVAVVIHYDVAPWSRAAIDWLCDPRSQASAHYHVGRDGVVTQMVDPVEMAWHTGTAVLPMPDGSKKAWANPWTIGIECGNLGPLERDDSGRFYWRDNTTLRLYKGPEPVHAALTFRDGFHKEAWWEPWDPRLITSLLELLEHLRGLGYVEAVEHCIGHEEIYTATPTRRKVDPGPLFPWDRFPRAVPLMTTSELMP